jgi:hypothetical protein
VGNRPPSLGLLMIRAWLALLSPAFIHIFAVVVHARASSIGLAAARTNSLGDRFNVRPKLTILRSRFVLYDGHSRILYKNSVYRHTSNVQIHLR